MRVRVMQRPLDDWIALGWLWRRFTWRHWTRAPKTTLLLLLLIALGVGAFFSIRLANRAAVAGFQLFTEVLAGESDLVVSSDAGMLDETVLFEIRRALGKIPVALFPVLETTASDPSNGRFSDGFNAEQYRVVGLDLISLANLIYLRDREDVLSNETGRTGTVEAGGFRLDRDQEGIFVSAGLAEKKRLVAGGELKLIIDDKLLPFRIAGVLPEHRFRPRNPDDLILMDLPQVQRLTGMEGKIHRIELRVPAGPLARHWLGLARQRLNAIDHGAWSVTPPSDSRNAGAVMTKAFRMNLTILSCLALIVATYLVFQALDTAVVRRRTEIAILRTLGITPRRIQQSWLLESLALGTLGSLLGLFLGWNGAQFAVRAVARTVNSLYYSNTTSAAAWDHSEAALAFSLGLLASLFAGWVPARHAALTPPAQVHQNRFTGSRMGLLGRPFVGWTLLVAAVGSAFLPPWEVATRVYFPAGGYGSALLFTAVFCLEAHRGFPVLAAAVARLGKAHPALHPAFRYAAAQLQRPSDRHRIATAALVTAVGMAAGMSILIGSFERTMTSWIVRALRADLYVACQGVGNVSNRNRIPSETWRALAKDPAVSDVEMSQIFPIQFRGASIYLVGASHGGRSGWQYLVWIRRPATSFANFKVAGGIFPAIVNESLANRFQVNQGDVLTIPTPSGSKKVKIQGIFADYGNERGSIVIGRQYLSHWFEDDRVLNLAIFLKKGIDADAIRRKWQHQYPGVVVRTNAKLRGEIMTVFHQTFSITYILKWIGLCVAVAGEALALISILIERSGELATLKALGMTRSQIALATALEGLQLSAVALASGLVLSVLFGYLLIYVINKQSFGWTLAFRLPMASPLILSLWLLSVSGLVGWGVGYWAAKLPSDREE